MKLALLCATHRGYLVLERLSKLASVHDITVFSFKEEPWEPPFFEKIRDFALKNNFKFIEAKSVGSERLASFWEETMFDLMLVVSWRYMIPARVYQRAQNGTFVFHDSLLPAYRGFSPTVWAMINGEDRTGVTLFEISDEVDAGPIIGQKVVPIGATDTIQMVMDRVTQTYLELLERYLPELMAKRVVGIPQDHSRASFTCKRIPEDNLINWSDSSDRIYNLIRAVTYPYPGAFTFLNNHLLRVWSAEKVPFRKYVGKVVGRVVEIVPSRGVVVLTGDGALLLTRVQLEGQETRPASDVLNSLSMTLGK